VCSEFKEGGVNKWTKAGDHGGLMQFGGAAQPKIHLRGVNLKIKGGEI
jgi:hypothetical protein